MGDTRAVVCREAGMDCDFAMQTDSEDELVDLVQRHAQGRHGMTLEREDVMKLAGSGARRLR